MSYFLRIFCKTSNAVTRRDLANFISEGSYFENKLLFEPNLDVSESNSEDWQSFTVQYQTDKRPVIFERNMGDGLLQQEIKELIFILEKSKKTKAQQEVLRRIQESTQVISIEIAPDSLTNDAWEMLDSVESYIAQKCDGIIYAPDEGFYDKKLQKIYKL